MQKRSYVVEIYSIEPSTTVRKRVMTEPRTDCRVMGMAADISLLWLSGEDEAGPELASSTIAVDDMAPAVEDLVTEASNALDELGAYALEEAALKVLDEAAEDEANLGRCNGSSASGRLTIVVLVMAIESTTFDWPVRAFLYWGKPHKPGMSVNCQPWLSMAG